MIYFIRLKDIPQYVVGFGISLGFLIILTPVWIANPSLVSTPAAVLMQMGFIVVISLIAASAICRWLKERTGTRGVITNARESGNRSSPLRHAKGKGTDAAILPKSQGLTTSTSPTTVAESVARLVGQAFASNRFIEMFGNQNFSGGWTMNDGLAVWHFFGAIALDVAVFTTIRSQKELETIRGKCDRLLSKEWHMSEAVLERFNDYMEKHAEATFHAYMNFKSNTESYYFRCVNRILGCELPFNNLKTIDLALAGYQPKTHDPALSIGFGQWFEETIIEAKRLIKKSVEDSPSMTAEPRVGVPQLENRVTAARVGSPEGNINEYPTDEEIHESWGAYKRGGEQGILEFLERQRQKREAQDRH